MNKEKKPTEVREFPLPKTKNVKAMGVEELQALPEFDGWTEEEITNLTDTVRAFTEIIYATWSKQESTTPPNLIIALPQERQKVA